MASDPLQAGREAYGRRAWGEAYRELAAADAASTLGAEDVRLLQIAADLTGRQKEGNELAARAYKLFVEAGEIPRAVMCAFHLVLGLAEQREFSQAGGWLGRARELLDTFGRDCVEQGYLLLPTGIQSLEAGDATGAFETFSQAGKIAGSFGDADLATLSRMGRGRALINLGEVAEGSDMLDQAMVAVTAGEVSPVISGIVYCAVIEMCREIFDLRRAQEWTTALTHWCSTQPGLVPYRGQCLVYRVEIMRLHGAWDDAEVEARQASDLLENQSAAPLAHYQQAELFRLRGEFRQAEESYRLVTRLGGSPQPGLAQLRLAQGRLDAAESSIRLAVEQAGIVTDRAKLLAPLAEILLAAGRPDEAGSAAEEMAQLAERFDAPLLVAMAAYAGGSVQLETGDAKAALGNLRRAWRIFRDLDTPYESARTRVLIGLACRRLGDEDTAEMELDAAAWVFRQLRAAVDQARVDRLLARREAGVPGGLTGREVEVLTLVAEGKTNRAIAAELFLAEKTVARHISNIFAKLDVSSRSAATAFAFQNHLIGS